MMMNACIYECYFLCVPVSTYRWIPISIFDQQKIQPPKVHQRLSGRGRAFGLSRALWTHRNPRKIRTEGLVQGGLGVTIFQGGSCCLFLALFQSNWYPWMRKGAWFSWKNYNIYHWKNGAKKGGPDSGSIPFWAKEPVAVSFREGT